MGFWYFNVYFILPYYTLQGRTEKKIEFNMNNIDETLQKDSTISKEAKDLLKRILVKDPDSRPRIEAI